jgi:hypothetical protein
MKTSELNRFRLQELGRRFRRETSAALTRMLGDHRHARQSRINGMSHQSVEDRTPRGTRSLL